MKKGTIICIVSVSLIGVGIVTSAIGFALGGRVNGIGYSNGGLLVGAKGLEDSKKSVYVDIEEELGEFKQIQVGMEYGDFVIEPSDHYGIAYHGREADFTYQVKDGKLIISQVFETYSGNHFFFFGSSFFSDYNYEQEYATVYVPENAVFESVSIENNGGDVDISNISADNLQVKADYGNVLLSNIKGEDYTVTMESGKTEIKSSSGNSLNLSNAYGEITLEEVTLENEAEIYAESGNIELNDVNIPNLAAESDYGDLYVSDKNMGSQYESLQNDKEKKISINCESGDIEIKQTE